jgi:4-hydroxy-2-oxoheptanedioate aldolase
MAAKYTPLGGRGLSGALPQFGFHPTVASLACPASNEATLVILQIESTEALSRCDEIVAVEGVDMLFVGANDLLSDLRIPEQFDDPRLMAGYERILTASRNAGKFLDAGGLQSRPDLAEKLVNAGASFVSGGTDLAFLLGGATKKADEIRSLRKQDPAKARAAHEA